ncbi:response regulator [Anabaena sp. FACHB-1237]|uniref:hybrid sensor histidine kinase/response regulator n=1 Tax=Anabaena sp. FACHB-1237 TaxID=2692769 RepID=UPI001680BC18|nr:response regulator [Anabaena sp. FACHB-1237]MBD2137283.1 response regulator [Anabaena sp. FACHB-1237]
MSKDKETEIKMQFLEEVNDHLNVLEGIWLKVDPNKRIDVKQINSGMRAAHSIKGGAAMMGFRVLSDFSHRLEDAFKVLKNQNNSLVIDTDLQSLLLASVDRLRKIVEVLSQGKSLDNNWLKNACCPIFDQLYDRLGDPTPEDITTFVSGEDSHAIATLAHSTAHLLFQTEVQEYLQKVENLLVNSENESLVRSQLMIMSKELANLGEMLELTPFTQLCESVHYHLEVADERSVEIAKLALEKWQLSHNLVLNNQWDKLPNKINITEIDESVDQDDIQLVNPDLNILTKYDNYLEDHTEFPSSVILDSIIFPEEDINNEYIEQKNANNYQYKERDNQENTVRVPSKHLEKINDLFGEIIVQKNGLNVQIERLRKLAASLSQRVQILDQEHEEMRTAYSKMINDHHELEKIGQKFHSLSQDAMETIVQVAEVTSDIELSVNDAEQIARKFNKTSKQLQRQITQVRMRPFSDLVERFPRAIRDLNLEYGKNVQLKIEGGNTLIERSILEAINEPLLHLLRNAFDHGIEDPATRLSVGKPEQGLISIKAAYHSNRTIITIEDDGRGISLERIYQRALKMGLEQGLLDSVSEEELLSLIFEPGFSTSEKVTALSGRGVGMDIVRNKLKLVGGDVNVDTQLGVGTTFTLTVPFTLSVERVLLIESDRLFLAFSTDVVAEIFLLKPEEILSENGQEMIKWQDHHVPLLRLNRYFQFNCSAYHRLELEASPIINNTSVLIIKNDQQKIAVEVERCWGEQEVAVRQVEGNIPLPSGLHSCTILGDGRVVPLVNTNDLVLWVTTGKRPQLSNKLATARLTTAFLQPQKTPQPKPVTLEKGTILVVDDSINVRRYLALTLEKGGYQVEQAKDGQDALEKLASGLPIQAVICDIEMPRIDGYTFLERVNADSNLQHIPVAMLTSRSSSKHRELAMKLGAKAYFSKPYNEQELLKKLEEIIFQQNG